MYQTEAAPPIGCSATRSHCTELLPDPTGRGTNSSNPLSPSTESVSAVNPGAVGEKPRTLAAVCVWRGREKGRVGCELALLGGFSLAGIDAVPPREGSDHLQRRLAAVGAAAWGRSPGLRLTCEQSVLLAPVQRQIEFRQTCRRELDGLPALQDRFDQLRA